MACFGFVDLDPSGLILSWGLRDWLGAYRHAVFVTAPSMTTPAVTYFQSATSSFRASATIVVLRRRPPLRFYAVVEPEGECRVRLMAQP